MEAPSAKPNRALFLGVFGTLFFLTLLLGAQTPPYNDGRQIVDPAENLVYHGAFGIPTGGGGVFHNPRPMFVSLVHVPSVLLRRGLSKLFSAADAVTRSMTFHLVPAAILGLTGVLLIRFLLIIGVGVLAASLSASALAFSTILFVYGQIPSSSRFSWFWSRSA